MHPLNSALRHSQLITCSLAASLCLLTASVADAQTRTDKVSPTGPLSCANGVYRLSPPGIAAAVYLDLANPTKAKVTLASVASEISDRIEIHKSGMEDGMMMMERLDELPVAAKGTIPFKPGGYHLMVFHPKRQLAVGDKVTFTLKTKSGKTATCETSVKKEY